VDFIKIRLQWVLARFRRIRNELLKTNVMARLDDADALRRRADEFRRQAGETRQGAYKDKLLTLAQLYDMRANLIEQNDALRRSIE
jgi:hypothetical protein